MKELALVLAGLGVLVAVPAFTSDYIVGIGITAFTFTVAAASLNLVYGYAGLLSFAQLAFWGIGGYCTALVVMDDAAFFMKNEVLLAGSVDDLCDIASPTPEEGIADGLKRFEEVRKAGQGKTLGNFAAHPATQQRLREVAEVMPDHASARMLALQGSGSRPRFLQRSVVALEIRSALEPIGFQMTEDPDDVDAEDLEKAHEASRARLDALAGFIDIRDRDLHKAATDVADSLRPLARLLMKKDNDSNSYELERKQGESYRSVRREYIRVMQELHQMVGDAQELHFPEVPKKD